MDPADLSPSDKYLGIIAQGTLTLRRGDFDMAEKLFGLAAVLGQVVFKQTGKDVHPLTLYCVSLLRLRQKREEESRKLREQAAARLESTDLSGEPLVFQDLMAGVLMDLAEYRRAIPFCEQAIQLALDRNEPVLMAELLFRAGQCYCRNGLWDHGAVPLRSAVRIFRECAGDPRLGGALISLGNALRKNSPVEAEKCYREVADLHLAKGEMESATVAWVNLGILCSEQGRHQESLEHYQRVLRVRESVATTPPDRLGSVLNNIANCYRRMGRFAEAHASVQRATGILEPRGGALLASAYGTRGLIFRDEGRDAEAVEWLQKSYRMRETLPSVNLDSAVEDLESEIAALKRLGRTEEAAAAEERLARVHATRNAIRPVDRDLAGLGSPAEGAVLVEIDCGIRAGMERNQDAKRLVYDLKAIVEREGVGYAGGLVSIPENTTLMLYGSDAEALYNSIEPMLNSAPVCRGATITIRQGSTHRQVMIPGIVN